MWTPEIQPQWPRRQKTYESSSPPARSSARDSGSPLRSGSLLQNENAAPAYVQTGAQGSSQSRHTAARSRPTAARTPESLRRMPPPACIPRPAPENIAEITSAKPCEQLNIHRSNSPPRPRAPAPPPAPSEIPDHVPSPVEPASARVHPECLNKITSPSPRVLPPAARKSPPRPHSSALLTNSICAAPLPCPAYPLRRAPGSTRTTPAVPTKTKIPQSTFSPPGSTPAPATLSPPPHAPYISPAPSSQSPESDPASSSNLYPRAPTDA